MQGRASGIVFLKQRIEQQGYQGGKKPAEHGK